MSQLLSLPGEVLAAIVDNLGPSQDDFDNFYHRYMPDVSLYRLSQTCTTFRSICAPKLYEICNIKTGSGTLRRSLGILRTLASRPEIASRVKRIIVDAAFYVNASSVDEIVLSAEDAKLFNRVLEEKVDMSSVTPLCELRATDSTELNGRDDIGDSLACVAFALVPNITSAIFLSHYASLEWTMTASFPLLEAFSIQHADTELGTDFESGKGVLLAAPNVRRLIGWSICSLATAEYTSVREVVLGYSGISDDEMVRLPVVFPNLERVSYTDGGPCVSEEPAATPLAISNALLGLRKTLKYAELGAPYEKVSDGFYDIDDADRYMESLAPMKVLESLRLQALHIYNDDDNPQEPPSTTELVHFLPTSIRRLCLEDVQSSKLDDILSLARSARHRFPKLTHVTFPGLKKSMEEVVCNTYEGHGIKCSFQAEAVNDYACSCD